MNSKFSAALERNADTASAARREVMYELLSGGTGLLLALEETIYPIETIVIRADDNIKAWQDAVARDYAPRRLVFAISSDTEDLPGLLGERKPRDGGVAYLCEGATCQAPILSIEDLLNRELS